jgi:hypothetical protein
MQPLDFLAAVLPSEGVYCVAELSSSKKEHAYASSLKELEAALDRFNANKFNTYFALATFTEEGSRLSSNAKLMRSLFVDLDCDATDPKKYKTQQDALDALSAFLQSTSLDKLGTPWIVSSGGGVHAYWSFTQDISIPEWKLLAENFKRLCKQQGLLIDMTVTADASRVLRVPGTMNWKQADNPRPVKILQEGQPMEFSVLLSAVKEKLNGHAVADVMLPGKRPTQITGSSKLRLFENTVVVFKTILHRTVNGSGCGQLLHYMQNAADDGMEPLWRGLLSLTKVCTDGEKYAKKLSSLHPYPEERMQQKLREIKGPYPCVKLDSENPGICTGCPHWGKITNPLALGRELQASTEVKEVEVAPAVQTQEQAITVQRPTPPKGFSYGKNGGVYREIKDEDAEGNKIKRPMMVLPYDLFVVDLLNIQGDHVVHMVALRPEGTTQVTLPQRAVVSKDETVKALAAQNVVASFGAKNDTNLFDYVRSCVEAVSAERKALAVPASFGWQDDGSFVTNGKIFFPNGNTRTTPMPGLENLVANTRPKGTVENWAKVVDMLIRRKNFDLLAVGLGVAFGSPIMDFSKLSGLVFSAGSSRSGTGKSLSLQLAASVWGDPQGYRINPTTSPVATIQRAGLLRSLPLVTDEVTTKNRKDFEWFPAFVFDISEGQGKERMESGANKERLNLTKWRLLAIVSSNDHTLDYLSGGRKHSSEGEMRRMLQWEVKETLTWDLHEVEILKLLSDNFGYAGQKFGAWLAANRSLAESYYNRIYADLRAEFQFTNDERFWHAGVASCVTGWVLAGTKHAGIVDLPIKALIESLKRIVEKTRATVKASARTAEDILNAYIRDYYGRLVVIKVLDGKTTAMVGEGGAIDASLTRTEIAGRVEHDSPPGHISFYIEEQQLKAYCSSRSFGYSDFKAEMAKLCVVEPIKKNLLSQTRGPQMRVNALRICRPTNDVEDEILQKLSD